MAFLNRTRPRGPGRFLQWKMRLLAVGAVLLLVGMAREMDLLVIVAAAVLVVAFVLRFFEKEGDEEPADAEGDDDSVEVKDGGEDDGPDWVPRRRATDAETERPHAD